MGRFDGFVRKVNVLTGHTARNFKTLDMVSEWAESVRNFLINYDLLGSEPLGSLLKAPAKAKVDLVGIIHNGRPVPGKSKSLKGPIPVYVSSILESAEAVRRYLIEPELQREHLVRVLGEIRGKHESLMSAIDEYDAG